MEKNEVSIHSKHRARVRAKYISDGSLDGYAAHNILEILLFYAIPRGDTNELAHRLITRFHSFSGVLNASVAELMEVPGVGENTAVLLSMLPHVFKAYTADIANFSGIVESGRLGEYICSRFLGETVEKVLLVCLDKRLRLLCTEFISDGYVDYTTVNIRTMLDLVMRHNASDVIIAHNHPQGYAFPSQADIDTTLEIKRVLGMINVRLIDHMIVSCDDYVSMACSEKFSELF